MKVGESLVNRFTFNAFAHFQFIKIFKSRVDHDTFFAFAPFFLKMGNILVKL
jgi:hypothetical protein